MKQLKLVAAAIQYIEMNLTSEDLSLTVVADAVHYSKFYLHRVFTAAVGLSIHEYAQRRRLTEAAKLLVYSDLPIIEIAVLIGYDSQQAFSSIFKSMYKQSPNYFRRRRVFYPLQLAYHFKDPRNAPQPDGKESVRKIKFAGKEDIADWMELVYLTVDGFPYWQESDYIAALQRYIVKKRALMLAEDRTCIGAMMMNEKNGHIDFLAVHPLYRKQNISKILLNTAFEKMRKREEVSITTFREGDKADTGYRKAMKELGFADAEFLMEFGYPTQRMVLRRENIES